MARGDPAGGAGWGGDPLAIVADPLAAVRAARTALDEATLAGDWPAARRHEHAAWAAAATLRPDGRIASVAAVCEALGCARHVYDDVVRRYSGRADSAQPRRGGLAGRAGAGAAARQWRLSIFPPAASGQPGSLITRPEEALWR